MYRYKYVDAEALSAEEYLTCLSLLPEEKRRRLDRLASPLSKRLSAAGVFLALSLAAELTGARPEELAISYDARGKPFVDGSHLFVSIAHSGVYALAAASFRPVGADIERIRPIKPAAAERFCSAEEAAYLRSEEGPFVLRAVRLWTMKEAFGKLRGTGVFAPGRFSAGFVSGEVKTDYGGFRFDFPEAPEGYGACGCEGR